MFVVILVLLIFVAGFGFGIPQLFGSHIDPPPIATEMSRPAEWLVAFTRNAERDGIPNTVIMAVLNEASDGQVFTNRYYCSNHRTAGEPCSIAFAGTHAVGIGESLMGLNSRDLKLPAGKSWQNVTWNLTTGIDRLASYLQVPYWQQAFNAFHQAVQTPPGWPSTQEYARTIKSLIERYDAGPTLGAWALADFTKAGQWKDPGNRPEWVLVVAAAPTGSPFAHAWRPPTTICSATPPYSCVTVHHLLSGHDLQSPVSVQGVLKSGQLVPFSLSTRDSAVTTYPGGTLFGAKVPLTGPDALMRIEAMWPIGNGQTLTDTIPWPESPVGSVGTVGRMAPTQTLQDWWPDIVIASQRTGVPADWIAAEMLNESSGNPNEGSPTSAYGLMQLMPGTARELPGWYPGARANPQENLILGAELLAALHQKFGRWRIASAAYYGGTGSVEADGVGPGMSWAVAGPLLATVPSPASGNTLTMEQYANNIEATSQAIARMHHS